MNKAVNNVTVEEKKTIVTKKNLLKAWWEWTLAAEVPVGFDRMQVLVSEYSTNKILRKLYKDDPGELQTAIRRHTSMFDTDYGWGNIIRGIAISLEEQRVLGHDDISPEVIQSLELGLMGPLAGTDDNVDQGIVATIPLAIFIPMALEGPVIAALVPGLIYIAWSFGWSWFLFNEGYSLDKDSMLEILHSRAIEKVIDITSIVGLFTIGCLSASCIRVQTTAEFTSNTSTVKLQGVIDEILPSTLPFIVVIGIYLYIAKRGPKYIRLVIYMMIIAIILTFSHII